MPNALDLTLLALITVVATLFETFVFFPRFKADVAAGVPNARRNGYRRAVIGQWALTFIAVIIWIRAGRSWTALGVAPHSRVRLLIGVVLVAAVAALAAQQARAIYRLGAERLAGLKPKFADVEFILPHTPDEYRWFIALSVTAGFCEELLYRGYLLWALGAYIGLPAAIVVGVLLFGVGHVYQGRRGATKAGVAGLAMSLIYVASGWLVPAMLVHALIDVSAGVLAFRVFSATANEEPISPQTPQSLAG